MNGMLRCAIGNKCPSQARESYASSRNLAVTEDELLFTRVAEAVKEVPVGGTEEAWVREASRLLIEAYNQVVRDEEVLVHYALKRLAQSPARS